MRGISAGALGLATGIYGSARAATAPAEGGPNAPCGANAMDYGARGDGQADDTAAIQTAIDAARGGIFFPPGRYRLTRPIRIELSRVGPVGVTGNGAATLVMAGAGPALHLIGTHEGRANPNAMKENVWLNQRSPLVSGFEILGEHEAADGVCVECAMQPMFHHLTMRGLRHGIHLVRHNRNVIIGQCNLYDNCGIGVYMNGVNLHQINIVNSHISYCLGGGVVCGSGSYIRNLQIVGCDIEGNMSEANEDACNVLFDAREGTVREGAIVGCTIQHARCKKRTANIRMLGTEENDESRPARNPGRFLISGNVISDSDYNIDVEWTRGITITGNTLWEPHHMALRARHCRHLVVTDNLMEDDRDPSPNGNGFLFEDCRDLSITGNHLQGIDGLPAALVLRRCAWANVEGNIIVENDTGALLLEDVQASRITGNILRQDKTAFAALRLRGGRDNMIADNLIRGELDTPPGAVSERGNMQV